MLVVELVAELAGTARSPGEKSVDVLAGVRIALATTVRSAFLELAHETHAPYTLCAAVAAVHPPGDPHSIPDEGFPPEL